VELGRHGVVTVDSPIVNIHGSLAEADADIVERQPLVVATKTMPKEAWVDVRAFSWMTALLHFDKVFQIPIVVAHGATGASYRRILECFSRGALSASPVLARVRRFFHDYAAAIQQGGPEYVRSETHLNIYWPADEFMLIQLVESGAIDTFYEQAMGVLLAGLEADAAALAPALNDAVQLNRALLKRPFTRDTLSLALDHNVWDYYRGVLVGEPVPLEKRPVRHTVDRTRECWWSWDDYCREVIWYANKKGAYLYGLDVDSPDTVEPRPSRRESTVSEPQLAGIY